MCLHKKVYNKEKSFLSKAHDDKMSQNMQAVSELYI